MGERPAVLAENIVPTDPHGAFDPKACQRPVRSLLTYYLIISIFTLFAFPIVFLVYFFKYETLKYRFEDEGIRMSWGILFRREINLTYRRIQDIHLTRNIIQRWMGLATVSIQTASGGSGPEMQIEGILQYESLRDYLYMKMRGAKGEPHAADGGSLTAAVPGPPAAGEDDLSREALALLRRIRDQIEAMGDARGGRSERES